MPVTIKKVGEKILTIYDAPKQEDAFERMPNYDGWIKTYLSKGKKCQSQLEK